MLNLHRQRKPRFCPPAAHEQGVLKLPEWTCPHCFNYSLSISLFLNTCLVELNWHGAVGAAVLLPQGEAEDKETVRHGRQGVCRVVQIAGTRGWGRRAVPTVCHLLWRNRAGPGSVCNNARRKARTSLGPWGCQAEDKTLKFNAWS